MIRAARDAYELRLDIEINDARAVRDSIRAEHAQFVRVYGRTSDLLALAEAEATEQLKLALLASLRYQVQQATKAGAA